MTVRRTAQLRRVSSALAVALGVVTSTRGVRAQPPPQPAATTAPPAAAGEGAAKTQLAAGDRAAKAKDWTTALAHYRAANAAAPSAQAQAGIAEAQYQMRHLPEAYDAYDQLLKSYGAQIGRTAKAQAEARLKELAPLTGYVSIRVSEAGANVTLDGASIGTSPVLALLRVVDGPHRVTVTKEGFVPVEQTVDVPPNGKQIVEVPLQREATTGHLVVKEKSGQPLRVILDGVDVGAAPYETDVAPGAHEVQVRAATLASPPQKIEVAKGKPTVVELVAAPATAHLQIATSDRQGILFLDGKPVAEGIFDGEVAVGPHTIAATREGFERYEKTIALADKQSLAETITLKRSEAVVTAAAPTERTYDGVYGGFGLNALFEPGGNGNELETSCDRLGATSCATSAPIGFGALGWVGYAWHPVGLELFLAGEYDQATPKATFDGTVRPGQNPVAVGVPRVEQFYFARFGGTAALRARVSFQSERVRGSFAAGFGLSVKDMVFERHAKTSDGLENLYVDKSEAYVSPALVLDGSVAYRFSPTFALAIGLLGMFETAGQDLAAPASGNQYLGGQTAAAPIPTPSYHLATSTQVFLAPYVGFQFGP